MNSLLRCRSVRSYAIVALISLCAGCVVPGGGYGGGARVLYGVDYYEPYGYDGGWGRGYQVGPPRDGDRHSDSRSHDTHSHTYRPAPASHPMPSIPSRSGPGGSRGNGGSRGH